MAQPRHLGGRRPGVAAIAAVGVALLVAECVAIAGMVSVASASEPPAADEERIVRDRPATGATVVESRTDGPIYDLPPGVGQTVVCDRLNREYLLLTTERGGVFLMRVLDEDGDQEVTPQE